MSRLPALRMLVKVRERRSKALDDAVKAAVSAHETAVSTERAANEQAQAALAAEESARNKLDRMLDPGQVFDYQAMQASQHHVSTLNRKVVEVQGEEQRCAAQTSLRLKELRERRAETARNRQKIDSMNGDIRTLLAQRQQAEDDAQDEEAEEAATSRLIAAAQGSHDGRPVGGP